MDIERLKQYLKIDGSDMDAVLSGYQAAAEQYLDSAGCVTDYSNKLYEVVVTIIVAKLLENPDLLTSAGERTGLTLVGLIAQLRMKGGAR